MNGLCFQTFAAPMVGSDLSLDLPASLSLSLGDKVGWAFTAVLSKYSECIDAYRERYGKLLGEKKFFDDNLPTEVIEQKGNLLLFGGGSHFWECIIGNGTSTSGQTLTFLNSSNAYIAVGDGGPTAGTGTISVANGSASVTFSSSQSGLAGNYITVTGDSSIGVYRVLSGSGTSWTLASNYGGSTAGSAAFAYFTGELATQTDLTGSTNKVRNAVDGGYPLHTSGSLGKTITAATNATPIAVTATSHGYTTGDFVHIQGVLGNTAANGLWQVTVSDANTFTLNNSVGNGAWTSGGLASKNNVCVLQATFGTGAANFPWYEWGWANGSSGGTVVNRKVASLGTKTSAASWAFKTAVALS